MELLTWPVSEDLIGRKVKCHRNDDSGFWGYSVGQVYVIGSDEDSVVGPIDEDGCAPEDKFEQFSFELLPVEEEEVPPITTTIDPSLIPEGYEFVRIGLVQEGDLYVSDGLEVRSIGYDSACPAIIVKKIEPKTKTMYNIHTGEPVEVPYDLTHNTTSASLTQSLDMKTLNVSLGFSSKETFKHFADELFTNDGKDLGV